MSTSPATRASTRAVEAPFVLVLGALGVLVAARVAWAARGGALVLLAPPIVVAILVVSGVARVLRDLGAAGLVEGELAAHEGREGEVTEAFVRRAKDLVDRAASTLPSVCILVGLLGTFAGLFEALVGSRDLLSSAVDAAAVRTIVAAPLGGLARAFGSSAAGIVGSVVLGLAESRFQGVADSIAVRLESVDDKRRTLALGAQLREALVSSSSASAEQAARDARIVALLERVAVAVEPLVASNEATRAVLAANESSLRELASTLRASDEASHSRFREAASESLAAVRASSEAGQASLRAVAETIVQASKATNESAVAAMATASAETRRAVEASAERLSGTVVSSVAESTRTIETSLRSAAERVSEVAARAVAAIEASGQADRGAVVSAGEAHAAAVANLVGAHDAALVRLEGVSRASSESIERATEALRAHVSTLGEALRSRDEEAQRAAIASLEAALAAWARRDEERYAREERERRARWEDDDARRSEWSGAEKLVLQSATEMIAERLALVAEVQARAAETVEAAGRALAKLEAEAARTNEDVNAQRARAEEGLRSALGDGARTLAETLVRESGSLVASLREELAKATADLEARGAAIAGAASSAEDAIAKRLGAVEAAAGAMAAQAADVARAVETLAEVLRAVPLEGGGSSGVTTPSSEGVSPAAPQGAASVQNDEDRAAFVACLEEARRWFDASQALQQKFLDEAAQLRSGGRP